MLSSIALTSFGADQPCQKLMVTGPCVGSSVALSVLGSGAARPAAGHAAAAATAAAAGLGGIPDFAFCGDCEGMSGARPRRDSRGYGTGAGGRAGRVRRCGSARGVEDLVAGGGEGALQRAAQDGVVRRRRRARSRGRGSGQLGQLGLDQLAQRLAAGARSLRRTARELGVEHGDHEASPVASPVAQPPSSSVSARRRPRPGGAAASGGGAPRRAGPCGAVDAELPGERRTALAAGQLLEAAAVGLRPTCRTSGAPGTGMKPTSPAPPVAAAVQPAAEDDGGADALLVPQQDEVVVVPGRAEPLLGDGGEVDVVLDSTGMRQRRGQLVQQGGGVPAGQVGGVAQPAGAGVEGAGRADDDPVQVGAGEPGGLQRAVDGLGTTCSTAPPARRPRSVRQLGARRPRGR